MTRSWNRDNEFLADCPTTITSKVGNTNQIILSLKSPSTELVLKYKVAKACRNKIPSKLHVRWP